MESKGAVFCIEGTNSRIKKLITKFDSIQMEQLKKLCLIAEQVLTVDLITYLDSDDEHKTPVETAYENLILTYISDYIVFHTYIQKGNIPEVLMGYSLGLNTALACSGYLTFEGGLMILKSIKKCLDYAYQNLERDMSLIVGLSVDTIMEYINTCNFENKVSIASINAANSMLITGERTCVQKITDMARDGDALKAVMLHTYMAFHYAKNEEWIEDCISGINDLVICQGNYPIMSVYSLSLLKDDEKSIKEELKKNVYCQMKWSEALNILINEGHHQFFDVSLDGNLRKISFLNQEGVTFRTSKFLFK